MFLRFLSALALAVCPALASAADGVFTAQFGTGGSGPGATTPVVRHGDDWHYRPGTNAPQADWKTASTNLLDGTWLTGPGGFGYEDNDDATVLTNMLNRYTTVYIRRQFEVPSTPGTNQRLRLIMDWDDGFVAWLDGNEIARSSNAPGAPGTEPSYNAISLAPNHEASNGQNGLPPTVYDLGQAADLLEAGTHILAVMGLNGAINSGDFSLIADLEMVDGSAPVGPTSNQYFTLVQTSPLNLGGSNTLTGAARVTVNGVDAVFSAAEGTWRFSQALNPGMNRLFIAALDAGGNILASTNRDVVLESSTTLAGGTLAANTSWNSGIVRITNNLTVAAGVTLNIGPGVVVLISPGVSVTAGPGGTINVDGADAQPVFVLPSGAGNWGSFGANGANSSVTLRHAETVAGQLRVASGGRLLIEDSVVRDLPEAGREIIAGVTGGDLTVRRSRVTRFTEVDARDTPVLIEHCLLEEFLVDGVDIKAASSPLIVRESTLRYGNPSNSNADAVDFGPGAGTVERCLIHHFPDKGVSIGGAPGTFVGGSLIYNCGIGISAYSSDGLVLANNTITECREGILFRNNPQPAIGLGTNLIVWGNTNNVVISNTSTLDLTYSAIQGGFTGLSNIMADPLFVNAAARDFRVQPNSPTRGTGLGGADMGVAFPVGGIPAAPSWLAAHPFAGSVRLSWREDSDNEDAFIIERSSDANTWAGVGIAPANSVGFIDAGLDAGSFYFYRVATTNTVGKSPYSNIASGRTPSAAAPETFVGGALTQSMTWTPAMGTIIVRSNVIVPTNIVLTIAAGANVKITNGVSIRATAGGVINILGTADEKVTISRWNTNAVWGELSAEGTNSSLAIRHANISGGIVDFRNSATGLIEDSYIHDYLVVGSAIAGCTSARAVTVRRSHFSRFHETLWQNTLMLIEDSLFENALNPSSDALDFDAAPPGSVIRRCTFRNGLQSNTDAIDIGPFGAISSVGVIIEDCLMYNFSDKGVSIGEDSFGIEVRNCLIYNVGEGVQVKDVSTASVYHNTIADSAIGLHGFQKSPRIGGGRLTNTFHNILSGNTLAISIETNSEIVVNFTDTHGTNWPGQGNINVDPLFRNPAARDYRLATNSPCIGAGSNGVTLGVTFPVGGVPAEPINLIIVTNFGSQVRLAWVNASGNESGFLVEASTNLTDWVPVANVDADSSDAFATTTVGPHFRVKATNFIGASFASNIASNTGSPGDRDGDGMPDAWENIYGFDSANPADALLDLDGDGASNLAEYRAGTHPGDAASKLGFTSVSSSTVGEVELTFIRQVGKSYEIQYNDTLSPQGWSYLIDVPDTGLTEPASYLFSDSLPANKRTRFYRLIIP